MTEGVKHPDLKWARECVKANKGDRVTDEELDRIQWNGLVGCYLMVWRGMVLGIEKDGHIHS
tara:strand:+ start:1959 stop:2144 length:186 start_codon:yes stop_codon:yes gene_type:complete